MNSIIAELSVETNLKANISEKASLSPALAIGKGPQGEPGPQGEKGDTGSQGIQGPKGDKGDIGEKGSKGDKGDVGPVGEVGPIGPIGVQGEVGPIGPQGIQGARGDKGEKGLQGAQGPKGIQGIKGEEGQVGPQGVQGLQGVKGDKGDIGDAFTYSDFTQEQLALLKGSKGDKGDKGERGGSVVIKGTVNSVSELPTPPANETDAYILKTNGHLYVWDGESWISVGQIKGDKGDVGPIGAQGPQGAKGDRGEKGLVGDTGPQGPTGSRGATGAQGEQGLQGLKGDAGPKGETGLQGIQGLKGDIGATGPQGSKGATGEKGDAFTFGDFTQAQLNSLKGAKGDKGDRGAVGATGSQGIQGIPGATGAQGLPGVKGDTGSVGAQGLPGVKGDKGDKGQDGLVTSVTVNGTNHTHVAGNIVLPNYPVVDVNKTYVDSELSKKANRAEVYNRTEVEAKLLEKVSLDEIRVCDNTPHSTVNGVKNFTCKNGYVDNIHIEGKTLINLAIHKSLTVRDTNIINEIDRTRTMGLTVTLFNLSDKIFSCDYRKNGAYQGQVVVPAMTSKLVTLAYDEAFNNCYGRFTDGWSGEVISQNQLKTSYVILEGDHTNIPMTYFEGIKSVGQQDKIEVLSYSGDNMVVHSDLINSVTGGATGVITPSTNRLTLDVDSRISIKENHPIKYVIEDIYRIAFLYLSDKNTPISDTGWLTDTMGEIIPPKGAKYLSFNFKETNNAILTPSTIGKFVLTQTYDKKQISHTLRSLPNRVKDEIYQIGDRYFKVQRCFESGLGNVGYVAQSSYKQLEVSYPTSFNRKVISNIFNEINAGTISDGIFIHPTVSNILVIRTTNSSITDKTSFEKYLNDMNFSFVAELATPIITEIPNPNPRTFGDKTTLLINSGAIQGDADFEVTNSLGSSLDVMANKISSLGDFVNEVEVYYPTLLNGWAGRSADYIPYFAKQGNMVTFNMRVEGGVCSSGVVLLCVPSDFRPKIGNTSVFIILDPATQKTHNAIMYKEGFLKLFGFGGNTPTELMIGGSYYVS